MTTRVLETVLTGRNLLSPVLAQAATDVAAFNSTVAASNARAATAATSAAQVQDRAADKVTASNVKASTSATSSAATQSRAHAQAAQSATMSARAQEAANGALIRSNGLLGGSLTPLTAGLGAVGLGLGYAAYSGMTFDKSMSRVAAASQASGAELGRLRQAALAAGAGTQYSAEEAAQGITELAKAGVSTADVLQGGLTGALNLAAAGEMEVADAAEIGATALSVFGLKGSQMSHVADLLAAGAGKAQGSVHDLGMALNQSALVANQTGLSIEDTTGALAMFAYEGLKGSDAGTSFKTMLQALTPNSEAASQAMDAIGFSAYDANGAFVGLESVAGQLRTGLAGLTEEQRNATLETIFGSDAVRAAAILYKQGAPGVAEWASKVNDAGFAARQAAANNDNLAGDLEKLGGAVKTVFTAMGEGAQGPLREAVQMLTFLVDTGGDVLEFWQSLPGPIKTAIVVLGAAAALKGPVSSALETMALKAMYMRDSISGASLSMGGLKSAAGGVVGMLGGPWGVALAAGTIMVGSFMSNLADAEAGTDRWTQALLKGGAAARKAREDYNNGDYFLRSLDEWTGLAPSLEDAEKAASSYFRSLSPIEQAQTKVSEWTATLSDRMERLGGEHEHTRIAQERLAYWTDLLGTRQGAMKVATEGATGALEVSGTAMEMVGDTAGMTVEQIEAAAEAVETWREQMQQIASSFVEPLSVYKGLLDEKTAAEREAAEETAASTESTSDSWKDYVSEVDVSLDELAARLEEQILNQENWRDNIVTVSQRAGADVAQILFNMGEEGVELTAKMADGTDAEVQRMADLLRRDTAFAGAGAVAELDKAMKVMAAIGAAGASATAKGIAAELGLGVYEVQGIAANYGVALASGLNPILGALGKNAIAVVKRGGASSYDQAGRGGYYDGGFTGHGDKYEPAGIVHKGEYVLTKEQTARLGIDRIEEFANRGYANGGFVTAADVPRPYSTAPYRMPISTAGDATMQKGFDEITAWLAANAEAVHGGTAGSGAIAGTGWQPIWNYVKARVPAARINSTYRAGDPGRHGRGLAIDFGYGSGPGGAGSAGLALINRTLHDGIGKSLAELIYDGIGDDRPDLRMGRPHTYSKKTQLQHTNHVHAAREKGGPVWPGQDFLVGERGPEVARFTAPATIYPNGTAPAAMPGYGGPGGGQTVVHHHYDESRKTQIDVDASNRDLRAIGKAVADEQSRREWLSAP